MKIGIAGVGGIGSNVAVNLVRSGVSCLKIVDFDRVEATNLNRQFYFHDQIGRLKVAMLAENLRRIRADIQIETVAARIDATNCQDLFADCALVVEGFDRQTDKKMLLETLADGERIVVSACGIAGHDLEGIRVQRLGRLFHCRRFCHRLRRLPALRPQSARCGGPHDRYHLETRWLL